MNDNPAPRRFAMDEVATLYPYSRGIAYNSTYRLAFVLNGDVDPALLRRALADLAPRFPSFFTQIRAGFFCYCLERAGDTDAVVPETEFPCAPTEIIETEKPAFRVIYHGRRLGLEIFHGVADGMATLTFFKTLAARYLTLTGVDIPVSNGILDITEPPKPSEYENCYPKIAEKYTGGALKIKRSYRYKAKVIPNYFRAIHGLVPVDDMKKLCREQGVSVSEYIAALVIYSLTLDNPNIKRPIQISVPINIRPIFGCEDTLRNFSFCTTIGFTPVPGRQASFADIIEAIKGRIKEGSAQETLVPSISRVVAAAKNPVVRFLPRVVKRPIMKAGFQLFGYSGHVCLLSNLGAIELPPEMEAQIDRAEVLMRGSPNETLACTVHSFKGLLDITFTAKTKNTEIQRLFFTHLTKNGARVRIEGSDREGWEQL